MRSQQIFNSIDLLKVSWLTSTFNFIYTIMNKNKKKTRKEREEGSDFKCLYKTWDLDGVSGTTLIYKLIHVNFSDHTFLAEAK